MRVPKTWLITDTHWSWPKFVSEGWRPADYEERICKAWGRLVQPEDLIYHLGDVIKKSNELYPILSVLRGTKILIRGNHDHETDSWYRRAGFTFVATGVLTRGVWLTHAPQATIPDGAVINVHGHLHGDDHRGAVASLPAHCKLLALEHSEINYAPVELEKFVKLSSLLL